MSTSPTNIKIRTFLWRDLRLLTRLFNQVNNVVDTDHEYDAELMRQHLSLPSSDPENNCFIAEYQNGPVGFVLVTPELPIGRCVVSGGVEKRYRRRGIGESLLQAAIRRSLVLKAKTLDIQALDQNEQSIGFLVGSGFGFMRNYSVMSWEGTSLCTNHLPEGFVFRPFGIAGDLEGLTELQNTVFEGSWGFSPNSVEDIRGRLGMKTCDKDGVIFATIGDRMAGYNWTLSSAVTGGTTGWISMTGVHPDFRGMGIGRAIVLAGIHHLVDRGVSRVELNVDDSNVIAVSMYNSLGFHRSARMSWFKLDL